MESLDCEKKNLEVYMVFEMDRTRLLEDRCVLYGAGQGVYTVKDDAQALDSRGNRSCSVVHG